MAGSDSALTQASTRSWKLRRLASRAGQLPSGWPSAPALGLVVFAARFRSRGRSLNSCAMCGGAKTAGEVETSRVVRDGKDSATGSSRLGAGTMLVVKVVRVVRGDAVRPMLRQGVTRLEISSALVMSSLLQECSVQLKVREVSEGHAAGRPGAPWWPGWRRRAVIDEGGAL